jgi:protein gp37
MSWLESALKLVIAGGESGPKARPVHPDWLRSLRDQCLKTGSSFYFKGWGEWLPGPLVDNCLQYEWPDGEHSFRVGRQRSGRLLDGRTWGDLPW